MEKEVLLFCTKCGTKRKIFDRSDFDPVTGKKIKQQACPKVGCEKNCNFFGCEYKKKWLFGTEVCIKCGSSPCCYY